MFNNNLFKEVYLKSIFNEDIDLTNKDQKIEDDTMKSFDDLADENITTIDESNDNEADVKNEKPETEKTTELEVEIASEDDDQDEIEDDTQDDQDDGWGEEIESTLEPIMEEGESLFYEIKNCKRGSFTNCETKEDLVQYLKDFATKLIDIAEEL